jgi:hypothetical protein
MASSRKLRAVLDAAERRIKEGKGISHEEFWKRVESSKRPRGTNGSGKRVTRSVFGYGTDNASIR